MSAGEVIFEKAQFVKSEPSKNYPNSTNFYFELPEGEHIESPKGTFTRVGISAGQIAKAMDGQPTGGWYRLAYSGSNVLTKGAFKGKSAHAFDLQMYTDDAADVDVPVAAKKAVETKTETSAESLTDMMS